MTKISLNPKEIASELLLAVEKLLNTDQISVRSVREYSVLQYSILRGIFTSISISYDDADLASNGNNANFSIPPTLMA